MEHVNTMKVSVCIPTYNQADYLELAIQSAANQTHKPFEIIVSNDCSTDGTYEVLRKLSLEIPNLKVKHQPENLGIAKNVDACLRMADGDFVIRLDSDDQLLPDYTKSLLELFSRYPQAGYAHAAVQEIDQDGNYLHLRMLIRKTGFQESKDALKLAIKGYKVAANIIMFKKEALIKVNYVTGRPNYVEDYHLTTSISAAGFGNIYLNQVHSYYRVWVDSGKVRQKRKLLEITGLRCVFEQVIEPTYIKLGWKLNAVKRSRVHFACKQSDCLSWEVYDSEEKRELTQALLQLSSSPQSKLIIWGNLNGFGTIISIYPKLILAGKSFIKSIIHKLRH
jgi:glycosyltransferase involved in cell wall biosynthesis